MLSDVWKLRTKLRKWWTLVLPPWTGGIAALVYSDARWNIEHERIEPSRETAESEPFQKCNPFCSPIWAGPWATNLTLTAKPPYLYTFIWCLRLGHVVFPLAVISHQTFTLDSHWATHKISHILWLLTEWLLLFHLFCLHPHSNLCALHVKFIDFPITKLPPLSNNTQLRVYLGHFLTLFTNYSTSACSFWDAPWFTW